MQEEEEEGRGVGGGGENKAEHKQASKARANSDIVLSCSGPPPCLAGTVTGSAAGSSICQQDAM